MSIRRVLLTFLLAALPLGATAAVDYYAFGDSVTRGSGHPFPNPTVFDDDPAANCDVPDQCGYSWRLEAALKPGIDAEVHNEGWAGERVTQPNPNAGSPGGVTRIDSVLSDQCGLAAVDDVLLLMEGTNDISIGVSTGTIQTNLGVILDKATAKCVHAAIASVIRRLDASAPVGSTDGELESENDCGSGGATCSTTTLRNKISTLATGKNRALVDVWASLCPDNPPPPDPQNCFANNYWPKSILNDPGHVDASGYDIMAPLFEAAITAQPAAGAATLTGPSGDVDDATPDFTWSEQANSDWYFLQVDAGAAYGRWHAEEEVCSGGVCSFDPGVPLTDGAHSWRVRTRNLRGVGSWSATGNFTVCLSRDLPETPPVTSTVHEAACKNLRALLGYTIGSGGVVSFQAGDTIQLGNGFEVLTGGEFSAWTDN